MTLARSRIAPAVLVLLATSGAHADEQAVRRFVAARMPDAQIVSLEKLRDAGIYEVSIRRAAGPSVFYVDGSARLLFVGNVIDVASGRDLTEERLRKLSAIDWNSLPFKWAITMQRGSGRREIAIFSDPNCPFCERFERDLARLDDLTVHVFMYPVIRPESVRQARAVWCSRDRGKAWMDLMHRRIEPEAKPDCDTPVEELLALGQRLGARSTPTWFLRSGQMYSGAMKIADLAPLLDAGARAR